jgi:hypothetical protein
LDQLKFEKDKAQHDELLKDLLSKISDKDWKIINDPNKHLDDILNISEEVLLHPWLRQRRFEIAMKIYEFTSK